MDYKEKVIAILNSKELSKEQKEKLEEIFPELKESEDEKIREELIGHINNMKATTISSLREKQFESWIAWLEKQEMSYTKRDVDDAYLKGVTNTKNEIEKQYEATYQIRKDIATFIFNYRGDIKDRAKWMDYLGFKVSFVEKQGEQKDILEDAILDSNGDGLIAETIHYKKETQGEQKPADNVEPKFQNGQWIVWQNKFYKVNYNGCGYELIDQNGLSTSLEYGTIDESARLWNIDEDAKDGDVLTLNDKVFIYAHRKQLYSIAVAHCFVDSAGGFYFDGEFGYTEKGNLIHPATKEQRDTLEKAMADAGYTFNFEKKELKKIEPKPWSEEDEKQARQIERIVHNDGCSKKLQEQIANWLKSLKDRMQPQPEQEWSKKDEETLKDIITSMTNLKDSATSDALRYIYNSKINWLKSLKNRYTWKPSDKQMKALYDSIPENVMEISEREMLLDKLYMDLKRL